MSEAKRSEILALADSPEGRGLSRREIARRTGCNESSVRWVLGHRESINTNGGDPVAVAEADVSEGLEFHPIAEVFPLMQGVEFEGLVADISAHGLRDPVVMYEGKVLDGRNRYRACERAGVAPEFVEWEGDGSPLDYVVSHNLHRRHLDTGQRASVAARLLPLYEAEAKERQATSTGGADPQLVANLPQAGGGDPGKLGKARDHAAEVLNVSGRSVADAAKVHRNGVPGLVQAMDAGTISVSTAKAIADLPKVEQEVVVAEGPKAVKAKAKQTRAAKPKKAKVPKAEPATAPAPGANRAAVEEDSDVESAEDGRTDEEWLATLPARAKLSPNCVKVFDRDALKYRRLASHKTFMPFVRAAKKILGWNKMEGVTGPYHGKVSAFLRMAHPRDWVACLPPDKGGCGGKGVKGQVGNCDKCFGRGYAIV